MLIDSISCKSVPSESKVLLQNFHGRPFPLVFPAESSCRSLWMTQPVRLLDLPSHPAFFQLFVTALIESSLALKRWLCQHSPSLGPLFEYSALGLESLVPHSLWSLASSHLLPVFPSQCHSSEFLLSPRWHRWSFSLLLIWWLICLQIALSAFLVSEQFLAFSGLTDEPCFVSQRPKSRQCESVDHLLNKIFA